MRIGMFADMYLPHVSGVTNHISLYKRHFEERGHEVFVFTFGDLDYDDAEPHVIRSNGVPWGDTGWRFSLAFSSEARQAISTLDIAHVHHPFQSGRLVLPLVRKHNIGRVFTNHTRYDLYSDAYATFLPRTFRYAYLRHQLRSFDTQCDLVIAPAASIAEWLGEFCGFDQATVIPNGIDVDRFANPQRTFRREDLGFSADNVVFCYAGRLGPEKNTEWLAREFAVVAADSHRARLLVVGDGPSRAAAQRILAQAGLGDRAAFVGMQPYDDVPGYEAVADVFVTGSVSEVHPLVVIEAMAAGLPVVAVGSPGISDTVADGKTGLLAPACLEGALAERMIALAGDDSLRERLSESAREAARAYAFENTADVVLGHYERIVARKARG